MGYSSIGRQSARLGYDCRSLIRGKQVETVEGQRQEDLLPNMQRHQVVQMVRHLDLQIVLLGIASVADTNVENIVKAALQLAHDPAPKDVRTRCRLLWPDQPDILRPDAYPPLPRTARHRAINPQMMAAPDDSPAAARVANRHPS